MSISINVDLIKAYLESYEIDDIVYNGESIHSLVLNGEELFSNIYTYTLLDDGTYAISLTDWNYSGEVFIPASFKGIPVTQIAESGFAESRISGVTFSSNSKITTIGQHAFDDCSGLTSIELPDSLINIEDYAFAYCEGLSSITLPDSTTYLGKKAFYACNDLTDIKLSSNLLGILEETFGNHFRDCTFTSGFGVSS